MAPRSRAWHIPLIVLRIGLGAVFGYAAWTKLHEPWRLFAMSVDAYHVLPEWGVIAVARSLPWLELTLAVLLVAGLWRRATLPAASVLLGVFFGLMVRSYARGEGIDCGCFGPGEAISPLTLLRDGGLLAVSLGLTAAAFLMQPHYGSNLTPATIVQGSTNTMGSETGTS